MWILFATALANEEGIVGRTDGCMPCHGDAPSSSVSVALSSERAVIDGGETVGVFLTVTSTDPDHIQAGLNVGASDGLLAPGATLLLRDLEVTHQFPHDMEAGARVFEMDWTAPAYAGVFTLSAAGNAVDGRSTATRDGWALASLEITVDSDCSDADGDRVGDCEGDCDDTDPDVYPGASEVWYDGVDQDCSGDPDDDADGDGVPYPEDCDDTDPGTQVCDTGDADPPVGVPPSSSCGGQDRPARASLLFLLVASCFGAHRRWERR